MADWTLKAGGKWVPTPVVWIPAGYMQRQMCSGGPQKCMCTCAIHFLVPENNTLYRYKF